MRSRVVTKSMENILEIPVHNHIFETRAYKHIVHVSAVAAVL